MLVDEYSQMHVDVPFPLRQQCPLPGSSDYQGQRSGEDSAGRRKRNRSLTPRSMSWKGLRSESAGAVRSPASVMTSTFAQLRIKTPWSWARAIATRMKSSCFERPRGLCVQGDFGEE